MVATIRDTAITAYAVVVDITDREGSLGAAILAAVCLRCPVILALWRRPLVVVDSPLRLR